MEKQVLCFKTESVASYKKKRSEIMVLKTLMKSIRQYKRQSIASPVFVSIEVIMECILPFIMA